MHFGWRVFDEYEGVAIPLSLCPNLALVQSRRKVSRGPDMDISIKNVPEDKVARLKLRAKRNHRSLQGELLAMIDEAIEEVPRKLSIDEIVTKVSRLGLKRRDEAVTLIRRDRDR
jgi:plasmid stability protein